MITTARLHERLVYEPPTGWLIWLARTEDDRHTKRWNTKHADKRAGHIGADRRRYLGIDGRTYQATRIIWQMKTGDVPANDIDHKNGDPSDDRWDNLRPATKRQNQGNRKLRKDAASGFKGVRKRKSGHYEAQMGGRYLGVFGTPEEAHVAYLTAAREHFGEFARGA